MKTTSGNDQANHGTSGDALEAVAMTIFDMLGDHQAAAVEIGEQVGMAIRGASPRAAEFRIMKLAAMLDFPARELVRCHMAHVVSVIAGDGLAARIPLGAPLDFYVQLFRIDKSCEDTGWRKDSILRVAGEYGRGMPLHEVSGLVDGVLAGRQGRSRLGHGQWSRGPAVVLARDVEEAAVASRMRRD